jgi:YebC/PmpR family DNA-binding regulatory protein
MAGHSKWANIKHKKAATDKVKGKVFSKIAKEITVAARIGGGDPSGNISLRALIQKARAANMPGDNIERAIKKGTGELEGAAMEEVIYEGFGAGGVSVIVKCLSDNRNRTAGEVRNIFTKHGGNMAVVGAVARSYQRKGQFIISADTTTEDKLLEIALDAGAEDVKNHGDVFEVICHPNDFHKINDALTAKGIACVESEVTMIPDLEVQLTDKAQASSLLKFIEALEELDDVQNVYSNYDIPDEIMAAIA